MDRARAQAPSARSPAVRAAAEEWSYRPSIWAGWSCRAKGPAGTVTEREDRRGISEYELIYWKSIAMLFMNYLLLKSYGAFPTDVPPQHRKIVLFRAMIGFFSL